MTQTVVGDPVSPAAKSNPYPAYAHLRANQPIHCVTLPSGRRRWLISRYDDAERALCDPRLVKTRPVDDLPAEVRPLMKSLISADPPDHTRLRALVRKAFSPRLVERLRPRIRQIADELLDEVAHTGRMDLIDDYAFPLPIMVITELLGVPSRTVTGSGSGPTHSSQTSHSPRGPRYRRGGEPRWPTSVHTCVRCSIASVPSRRTTWSPAWS
jgi:cytochrome P450